jgi:general secretion pathway protein D
MKSGRLGNSFCRALIRGACVPIGALAMLTSLAATSGPTAATEPSTTQPSTQPSTMPATFSLNFKDVPLDTVLNFLSQNIGFQIISDGAIDTRVTIISKKPVTAEQAITMLSAALKVNGFAVTREGQILHISSRDKAKKGNVPVHFGNNPADIADSDELITQVIPIANVSALKLRDDLKPLMGADADVSSNEGSNSIIITDTSSSVRRIVEIISHLDEHESTTSEIRIIELKHANASATAKLIDTLFKTSPQGPPQNPQFNGGPQPPQPNQGGAGGGGSERHGATVVTAADDRTNTLVVMASSDKLDLIAGIVKRLDTDNPNPAPATEIHAYQLRYAAADATAKLINDVFKTAKPAQPLIFLLEGIQNQEDKGPAVNAVSDDRSNTLIVTAPPDKVKDIEALILKLDASPMVSQELRVIHLKYADAENVAKLLEDTYSPKKEQAETGGIRLLFLGAPPDEQHVRGTQITFTSDERTNTVLISAPKEVLDGIERVVRELDSNPATEDTLFVYHLRNSQATHLEYTLNVLFGNITSPTPNNQQNQQNLQQNGLLNSQNSLVNNTPPPGSNNNNNSNNGGRNNNSQGNRNNANGAVAKALSELNGQALVVADPDTNSLLVTTATKYQSQVKALIAELDRPAPQVLIRCLIAEVTHDNSADFGTDFSVLNLRASGNGQKLGSVLGAAAAAASATTPPGLVVSVLESNLTATLQALAQENKLDVLSRPYILTSDNQQANITVGSEVPFVTGTNVDAQGGIHNTAQYQNIGIILNVTPHINPEGMVTMEVSPQISSLTSQTVPIQTGVSLPVFDIRSADSYLTVRDGQTIVIGGLMQDQKTSAVSKIPILGDIPLIGKLLFSYTRDDKSKTELLIFLTPHVAPEPDHLKEMGEEEIRALKLTPTAVAPGVFAEHLRGMQIGGATPATQPISPIKSIDLRPTDDVEP